MFASVIERLGEKALLAGVDPLARDQRSLDPVLGFDTEYDSRTRRLVCFQLAGEKGAGLYTERLTVQSLAKRVRALVPEDAVAAWLVTFWSYAELQFLPVVSRSFEWRLYGAGSFDCAFDVDGFELRIFDLARFFERSSLEKVALSFGLEKKEWNRKKVSKRSLRFQAFREYAIHDARLCFDITEKLRAEFLPLGADPLVSKTAAGVSATVFRRRYVKEKIRCKLPAARMAGMLATWGGRAEAFQRGKFPEVFEYDLDSAYPRAAVSIGLFPEGHDLQAKESLRGLLRCRGGFARVVFKFPKGTRYPCLPVVTPFAQVYPLEGVSWATTFEVERACELGARVEILEAYGYTEGTDALPRFMRWALDRRAKLTGAGKVAAKLMANSLIGKLAQRRSSLDIDDLRQWAEDSRVSIHDAINLSGQELETLGLVPEAKIGTCFAPEWNALITGHVRARLSELLEKCEPVYCATDSVWTRTPIARPPKDLTLKRHGAAVVVRTRLGGIWEAETGKPHLAHHSIWTRKAGLRLLEGLGEVEEIRYYSRRAIKLRESLRRRLRLATFLRELRVGSASWDAKRRLLPSGATLPWRTVEEYLQARKALTDVRQGERSKCRRSSRPRKSSRSSAASSREERTSRRSRSRKA